MTKYLKLFETTSEYEEYINGSDVVLPNVSVAKDALTTVYYNPYVPPQPITYTASEKLDQTWSDETTTFGATIKSHTFENGVGTIEFNDEVTKIGGNAFRYCWQITSITIPDSITNIGNNAFQECSELTSVTIGSGVTSIGNNAFQESGLTSITIPNSVTSIGYGAFDTCSGLTSVTIGSGVTSIGENAFSYCSGLTSITIPDSVITIGDWAIGNCESLTSVTIGSGVTSIGGGAFSGCSGLTSITSLAATAPTITDYTFENVKTGGTLTVPSGSTGYDIWMGTGDSYLGKYSWTKVEQ